MKKALFLACLLAIITGCTKPTTLQTTLKNTYPEDQIEIHATIEESMLGLVLTLEGGLLSEGDHEMHIHEMGSCMDHGKAAGGHYDPMKTEDVTGEYIGKLPTLSVSSSGKVMLKTKLPGEKRLRDFKGRSIMIHERNDDPDRPGERIACGVFN